MFVRPSRLYDSYACGNPVISYQGPVQLMCECLFVRPLVIAVSTVLLLTGSGRALGTDRAPGLDADRPPNIVFIIADDLRFDLLGCNGHPHARTPNLDRLAREGVNFTRFCATTPLCSPSRASFLTGLYPHSNRIINNDDQGLTVRSHRLMTFPRILREEADYVTGYIGKWHMGFDDSRRPGFDHWISFRGQGQFIDPVANINGQRQQLDGYLTDLITQWGIEFLQRDFDRPFCLVLSHEAVHRPFIPAKRHESLYEDLVVKPPQINPQELAGKRALTRRLPERNAPGWFGLKDSSPEPGEPRRGRPEELQAYARDQLRCLTAVDEGVGEILECLEATGCLDNTVVIFTSDQGFLQGEFGQSQGKRWPYDPCLRVPFLMRYPKLATPESVVDAMVLNIDVAPTILSLAGVQPVTPVHGQSFLPLLKDAQSAWRESFLFEYFAERVSRRCPQYFGVRTVDWKYVHYPGLDGMDELYDLKNDPGERVNLIDRPAAAEDLQRLQSELLRLHRQYDNQFALSLDE